MKKVLVIGTSLRAHSNSQVLADAFAQGAREAGNEVEELSLRGKTLKFCQGCLACQKIGKCVMDDDANGIAEKMKNADVIAFATPIYYYEMSGQMITLLDRVNCLFDSDYRFRDIYLLSAAAEDEAEVDEGAVHGLKGWIACFEKSRLAGTVVAAGVTDPGEIQGHPSIEKAHDMGASIH